MLAEASFDNRVLSQGGVAVGKHGQDANLFVEFYADKVLQTAKTDETGELVYEEVIFISIKAPGDSKTCVVRPAKLKDDTDGKGDPARFPVQWDQFKRGVEQRQAGHGLELLGLAKSELKHWESLSVVTIEALAGLPDNLVDQVLGGRGMRNAAIRKLAELKESAVTETVDQVRTELAAANERASIAEAETATLKAQVAALQQEAATHAASNQRIEQMLAALMPKEAPNAQDQQHDGRRGGAPGGSGGRR